MGYPDNAVSVNLKNFWDSHDAIQREHDRFNLYTTAAEFWSSYHNKLSASATLLTQTTSHLKSNATWGSTGNPSPAATAFYQRMDGGVSSINSQVATAASIQKQWSDLTAQLTGSFNDVESSKSWLLQQAKYNGGTSNFIGAGTQPITAGDTGPVMVDPDVAISIGTITSSAGASGIELALSFAALTAALNGMPQPQWAGPHSPIATPAPSQPGGAGGAGGGGKTPSAGAGGAKSSTGAGTSGGKTSSTGTGSSSSTGGGGSTPSTSPSTSPSTPSTSSTTDQSGSSPSLGDGTGLGSGSGNTSPSPLPADPTLAGSPTGTLPPPTSSAGTGLGTGGPGSVLSGTGLGPSSSSSFTPIAFPSMVNQPGSATEIPLAPNKAGSAGSAGSAPGEQGPTLANESVAAGSAAGGTAEYLPPMMPPMQPGAGGQGGVQAGEADGAGGPAIRWTGRDSRRAGLLPELQGRGGQDEESVGDPMRYPSGGQVLDEELWQVSGVAPPVTPPGPEPRRGRSHGF